jgi:4-phospho-D-threonate 3-dehydrogenase / 4-phospho-D-erythronate 3-dehydrogenase
MNSSYSTSQDSFAPVIAITMGDAAGIGPEIIVKALLSREIRTLCRPVVIGDSGILENMLQLLQVNMNINRIRSIHEITGKNDTIDLIDLQNLNKEDVIPGEICSACGKAAIEYIEEGARLALKGSIDALVTAPLNKKAAQLAGCTDTGHLELFARLSGTAEYATMLMSGPLRVVHHTTHYPLKDVFSLITRAGIAARLKLIDRSFKLWGISHPCIGVAALNPHAGEGGMLGSEEIEEITPAIEDARKAGIDAYGPFPADTVFTRCISSEFDVVLAMYHDQGHIPVKVYGFEKSVSVALGLPFIRTSVDHGTAFDIAGKGIAGSQSMEEAVHIAIRLARGQGLPEIKEQ